MYAIELTGDSVEAIKKMRKSDNIIFSNFKFVI